MGKSKKALEIVTQELKETTTKLGLTVLRNQLIEHENIFLRQQVAYFSQFSQLAILTAEHHTDQAREKEEHYSEQAQLHDLIRADHSLELFNLQREVNVLTETNKKLKSDNHDLNLLVDEQTAEMIQTNPTDWSASNGDWLLDQQTPGNVQ